MTVKAAAEMNHTSNAEAQRMTVVVEAAVVNPAWVVVGKAAFLLLLLLQHRLCMECYW